ncbi:Arylsulfotransferase (ASST) [Haladaptatus litoreus]|uniref:Arylsulfotransferase (ASST) n=2 Tax=Haladaptatus litoreus TaxID=553468 RepID=A0A1N7FEL1_9EURY|nr:Arylsulfotransferase (ASST) [Haladaptatus litoreus]
MFAILLMICISVLASGYTQQVSVADPGTTNGPHGITNVPADEITVVTDHKSPTVGSKLVALGPNKEVVYYNATLDYYSDVDPSPDGKFTVTYVGVEDIPKKQCDDKTRCRRIVIERLNMSTDEVDRLYSRVVPTYGGFQIPYTNRWHDIDRVNDTHFAVADIERDRVFIVNTSSEIITWQWQALAHYSYESGGPFPNDFTHVNDVEVLPDGRIMASIRNQDEVVFINRTSGVNESWTLGEEDNHTILFGQHNPDYIPKSQGGPAVIVADSHNDRAVEYQRVNGTWKQSWVWKDNRMQWTRDADRLPNGHTLITDTHGNRVIEVNKNGEIIWNAQLNFPYDAERLGTGDESAGGSSAQSARLTGRANLDGAMKDKTTATTDDGSSATLSTKMLTAVEDALPAKVLNAALYVMPGWFSVLEVITLFIGILIALIWSLVEVYWRGYRLRLPIDRV